MAKEYRHIGQPSLRVDAREKVTGRAIYTYDLELPGMLYAKCLHSPHAAAKILSYDLEAARSLPGVRAVLTGEDIPYLLGLYMVDKRVLAIGDVRYQGEAVVAVAATDEATAEKALSLVKVEYELQEPVMTIDQALSSNQVVHEDLGELEVCDGTSECAVPVSKPVNSKQCSLVHADINCIEYVEGVFFPIPDSNIASWNKTIRGDVKKGFAEADRIIENEFTMPPVAHFPMETHVVVAQADPYSDKIKIWTSTQSPFGVRQMLAKSMGISRGDVQVIAPYVGGGFGGKAGIHLEPLAAVLSKHCGGWPVKLIPTREEETNQLPSRAGMRGRIKTGVKNDGTIVAEEIYYDWDSGAYADYGVNIGRAATYSGAGAYEIPNIELHSRTLYTNKVFSTAYRGFGHLETHWTVERQMDLIAQELGLDPYEVRMKNILQPGKTTISGEIINEYSGSPADCLEAVAKEIGWTGYRSDAERKAALKTKKARGKGIACLQKAPAMPPFTASSAIMQMDEDGNVRLMVGGVDMGQGSSTVMAQIAAEVLDLPLEKVQVIPDNNTDTHPYDWSTVASKYTFMGGNAVKKCAANMLEQMKEIAAQVLRTDKSFLAHKDGYIYHVQHPQHRRLSYVQLALGYAYENGNGIGGPVIAHGSYMADGLCNLDANGQGLPALDWTFGAHGIELEVDLETGEVHILKIASAFDVGQAINRRLLEGQIVGGVIQGIGSALIEKFVFNEKGTLINPSFTDNKIPTAKDLPDQVIPIIIENPAADGPFGARGIGEHPMISVPSVVANALYDALGINFTEMPMTPEKVALAVAKLKTGK